jgi:hypothetical protein
MNNLVIFLFIALAILIFSIISVSVAPIINNILGEFSRWGKFNCQYYADSAKYSESLDEKFREEKLRNLCYRQNGMYGLEYSSFIIDLGLGFICAQLALLHYFQIGKSFEKITGLIGLIGGGIGFILTLIYVCFSGYIFTQDAAFKTPELNFPLLNRLYPNGASYKKGSSDIYVYSNDKSYDSQFAKYKDLGDIQYNYNKKFYEAYYGLKESSTKTCINSCDSGCDYCYTEVPKDNNNNKYLYDRWCLSLVLAVFITISDIGLLIFGFLICKSSGDSSGNVQEVKIE